MTIKKSALSSPHFICPMCDAVSIGSRNNRLCIRHGRLRWASIELLLRSYLYADLIELIEDYHVFPEPAWEDCPSETVPPKTIGVYIGDPCGCCIL